MKTQLQKLQLALVGTALSLGTVGIEAAQAAYFTFSSGSEQLGYLKFEESPLTGIGQEITTLSQLQEAELFFDNSISYTGIDFYTDPSTILSFTDGKLTAINSLSSISEEYDYYGGSRGGHVELSYTLIVKGDRYGIATQGTESFGGFDGCEPIGNIPPELLQGANGGDLESICQFSSSVASYNDRIEETGIYKEYALDAYTDKVYSYTDLTSKTIRTPYNNSYNDFIPFEELPQITFTTIEPVSSAIPEPLTILGAATALGFGVIFKKSNANK